MLLLSTSSFPATAASDERLALQAQREPQAYASAVSALYERHADRVCAYCLARTGNLQDAQDLTSEVFVAALKALPRYDPRRSFAGWLYGIAQHKVVDFYRRGGRSNSMEMAETMADPGAAVELLVEERLQMQVVAQALGELNAEQTEAVSLRIFAGLSAAEAGVVMGRSEAAVKMLVYRAMRALQDRLGAALEVNL